LFPGGLLLALIVLGLLVPEKWYALAGGLLLVLALAGALGRMLARKTRLIREHRGGGSVAGETRFRVIDNTRPLRDCQTPPFQGICTGLECYEYPACDFAIKKPVPGS
jgi:hypothetical protein